MGADALFDAGGQVQDPGLEGIAAQQGREVTEGAGEERVPGDVEAELAGVVAGPEGLEHQTAFPGEGAAALAHQGVRGGGIGTREPVGALRLMMLFGLGDLQDDLQRCPEFRSLPAAAAECVQAGCQVEGEGQRVEFPLTFPDPRPLGW